MQGYNSINEHTTDKTKPRMSLPRRLRKTMSVRRMVLNYMKQRKQKNSYDQEKARRVSQMEKGMLTASSGVVQ